MHSPILVIGNGGAAAHAVMAMRASGYQGQIDLVAEDKAAPFNPMLLPYFLKGVIGREGCHPFGLDFYQAHGVTTHLGLRVAKLDAESRTALLDNGEQIDYEQCLIATGATTWVPPVPGLREAKHTLFFRTRMCGELMDEAAQSGKSAIVLGASLVGAKLAEVLSGRGLKVTLVDLADRLIPGAAHLEASQSLQAHFDKLGVKLLLSYKLSKVSETSDKITLHFDGQGEVSADFACVCTGVRSNLGFVDPEQVKISAGMEVDRGSRTSMPGLYAAGDAARGFDLLSGEPQWYGLWGKACQQGRAAGCNMTGREASYPGTMPEYITPLVGRAFAGIGQIEKPDVQGRTFVYHDQAGAEMAILRFADGILQAVNLISGLEMLGLLRTAILRRMDLSRFSEGKTAPALPTLLHAIEQNTRLDLRSVVR